MSTKKQLSLSSFIVGKANDTAKGPAKQPKVIDIDGGDDGHPKKRKAAGPQTTSSPKRTKAEVSEEVHAPATPPRKVRPNPPVEPSPPRSPVVTHAVSPAIEKTPKVTQTSSQETPKKPTSSSPPSLRTTPASQPSLSSKDTSPPKTQEKKTTPRRWFPGGKGGPNTGAKNPGSKDLPVGAPSCLQGKTFVVTGQLESLDRQAADDFIMRHGGTVRTTVSSKTHYLVVGEDAGVSKMEKAEKFRTKKLTEDELIELVVELSEKMGVNPWAWKTGDQAAGGLDGDDDAQPMETDQPESPQPAHAPPVVTAAPVTSLLPSPRAPSAFYGASSSSSSSSSATPLPSQPTPIYRPPPGIFNEQLWADKYRPASLKSGMVAPPQATELKRWLEAWQENIVKRPLPATFKKAALLSGSPGIGKTTSAHLVGKECGYEVVEWNASDKRSKKDIDTTIMDMVNNTSVVALFHKDRMKLKKCCIIMDEVDGCDRGGVGEVIQMIHRTRVPIICICNDRQNPKVKSLANHCLDLKFNKPNRTQVAAHLQKIIRLEGHDMPLPTLESLVSAHNNDIRNLLNSLQMWFRTKRNISHDEARGLQHASSKDHDISMYEAPDIFLTPQTPKLTISQLRDIYFTVDFLPLFVQENYVNMRPENCRNMDERMDIITNAADSIALGDISETLVRRDQNWGLSSVGVFQAAIYPSALVRGKFEALRPAGGWADNRLKFPSWLGQNSSRKKNSRMITCITKAASNPFSGATGSSAELRMYYFNLFTHYVTAPLAKNGKEGIDEAIAFMDHYHLGRDDWEFLQELQQWKKLPMREYQAPSIDSATQAAFTRSFNKTHLMSAVKAVMSTTTMDVDDDQSGETAEVASESDEAEDLTKDALIVAKKKPPARNAASSAAAGSARAPKKAARAPRAKKG